MLQVVRQVTLGDPPGLRQLAEHHAVVEDAIRLYHSPKNPNFHQLFTSGFDTPAEIRARWDLRLREARTASALMLLAAIEASFRVDYRQRNYRKNKKKDGLSRAFRDLYQEKGERVSLSDDILQVWLGHPDVTSNLVGKIRAAFKYRHWLAHGRYCAPKLGRKYDFQTIYDLGRSIEDAFPFLRS